MRLRAPLAVGGYTFYQRCALKNQTESFSKKWRHTVDRSEEIDPFVAWMRILIN
jgi:hypothetical protein